MADSKISNLNELATAPDAGDLFVIVDVSDTSMSASGTTKKIQSSNVTISDASTTVKGKVELATDAETITGTDTVRAVTPSNITAKMDTDGTLAGNLDTRIPSQKAVKTYGDRALNTTLTIHPLYAPEGFLINGKIEVTDASGITVALKTLAGATPSATDPIYIRIGNTVRTITSATTAILADGTNWFNAGSAELATKEIDYFAYAVYDSNSSVVALTFARIPSANLVSDFSATTTNEKHCANYANFTSTDEVEVIGRFAATLSAGAGYTWSVPTYTAINLIQRPIYETRLLDWIPTTSASAGTFTTTSLGYAKYKVSYATVKVDVAVTGTTSSTPQNIRASIPFTPARESYGSGYSTDITATVSEIVITTSTLIYSYLAGFVNYSAGVTRVLRCSGEYEII